jgi:uncharacterized protein
MSALRQPVRRRRFWIAAAVATLLAVAAVVDWSRPPERQLSVRAYERVVLGSYGRFVRPVTSVLVSCRYRPSCSRYSLEAVRGHGFPVGFWMTTKRIFRCMPWVPAGTRDPVPRPAGGAL